MKTLKACYETFQARLITDDERERSRSYDASPRHGSADFFVCSHLHRSDDRKMSYESFKSDVSVSFQSSKTSTLLRGYSLILLYEGRLMIRWQCLSHL